MDTYISNPWFSLVGFLGLLGFIPLGGEPNYFFCIFFSFFSWYWWSKLSKEKEDERLKENQQRAQKFMMTYFAMLSFFMLFFLDRGTVSTDIIILIGSLGYALGFILSPALIYYFDKVQD